MRRGLVVLRRAVPAGFYRPQTLGQAAHLADQLGNGAVLFGQDGGQILGHALVMGQPGLQLDHTGVKVIGRAHRKDQRTDEREMDLILGRGLPDTWPSSWSCASMMAKAGVSPSRPPNSEPGTRRLERRDPSS